MVFIVLLTDVTKKYVFETRSTCFCVTSVSNFEKGKKGKRENGFTICEVGRKYLESNKEDSTKTFQIVNLKSVFPFSKFKIRRHQIARENIF